MRVYLIGFMGCGKTTFGKKLARKLGCDFLDIDKMIEQIEQVSVSELFAVKGETYFRKLESDVLHSTVVHRNAVVSCGGGTPCYFDNMEWMNQRGVSVYLQVPAARLYGRLKTRKHKRPLIANLSDDALKDYIFQKLSEREAFYMQAQMIIEPEKTSAKKVADELKMKSAYTEL